MHLSISKTKYPPEVYPKFAPEKLQKPNNMKPDRFCFASIFQGGLRVKLQEGIQPKNMNHRVNSKWPFLSPNWRSHNHPQKVT